MFLSTSYMHVRHHRTAITGPRWFTELQRSWPEQWSQINEIRRCAVDYATMGASCSLLTCTNYAVHVAHCFWVLPVQHTGNFSCWLSRVLASDELAVWCADHVTRWRCVTTWLCDDLTGGRVQSVQTFQQWRKPLFTYAIRVLEHWWTRWIRWKMSTCWDTLALVQKCLGGSKVSVRHRVLISSKRLQI